MSKSFAIIGAAGYIAPKHMRAIKETGNNIVAAYDPYDSIGVIDNYFPNAAFFKEFERFDRHLDKFRRNGNAIDYCTICSPNYLHDAHIRFGIRNEAHVICEKPVVLNPWNVDTLVKMEEESGRYIYTILQLRLHPIIVELRNSISTNLARSTKYDIELTYITSRGNWYYTSWKGDITKSGGIATNIGIHFFDMLCWIFGDVVTNTVHVHTHDRAAGYMELEKARVKWFLSINEDCLPTEVKAAGKRTYRSLVMDNKEIEFSEGFTDLHTMSYQHVLSGEGFRISESRKAIDIVHNIRHAVPAGLSGDYHPLAKLELAPHPFTSKY